LLVGVQLFEVGSYAALTRRRIVFMQYVHKVNPCS